MKTILYSLLIVPLLSVAGLNIDKVDNVLLNIKLKESSKTLTFFNANKSINLNKKLKFTSLENANIILFPKKRGYKKMIIVDSYQALQRSKNSIGAIYLKKGRTQIIFIEERLKKNGLTLPRSYHKHLFSECQITSICLLSKVKIVL